MSQYSINNSTNCFNTTNSHNTVSNNYTVADERPELLAWLSPLEHGSRHWGIQERHVPGVGEWLIRTEEFRRWRGPSGKGEGDKRVLFCYGNPGAGKTFISSLVADRLCDQAEGQNTAVTCFYFDLAARNEQSATSMLGSLLKQVVSGMETIPGEISQTFQEHKKTMGGRRPQLPTVVEMLQAITSSQPTFICIDALDECAGAQRVRLLNSLNQILEKSPDTRVFATGRPYVRDEIEERLAGRVTSVSISPTEGDITTYLSVRLREDETPAEMDESLKAAILEKISQNISEMFLLVSLNLKAILRESTKYQRRERLRKITDRLGSGGAYEAMIERIKAQDGGRSRLGIKALMWISNAERPLRVDELCHALAVELGSTSFNADNVPSMSTVEGCCQGLITVDQEASTVRLIHITLQEYLFTHPDIPSRPHSAIAEVCLTYLNSKQVKFLSADPSPDTRDTPFLEYCSVYWGVHAKKELSDRTRLLALELLEKYDGHISGKLLLGQARHLFVKDFGISFQFNGLHCASLFGIVEIAGALIEIGTYGINGGDFVGYTPLAWAARNGHDEMVKMLLEQEEIDPDKPDNSGQTPLSRAAGGGHKGVVHILLARRGVNPDGPNNYGLTPLLCAAQNGHEGVVKILLERGEVNPDKPNRVGVTPLSYAARCGHEEVVKILLRREVNPNKPDNRDQTPLMLAARYGHKRVTALLQPLK